MNPEISPGKRLRAALTQEQPLQVVGVINAYCAILSTEERRKGRLTLTRVLIMDEDDEVVGGFNMLSQDLTP